MEKPDVWASGRIDENPSVRAERSESAARQRAVAIDHERPSSGASREAASDRSLDGPSNRSLFAAKIAAKSTPTLRT